VLLTSAPSGTYDNHISKSMMFGMAMACIQVRQTAPMIDPNTFVKRDAIKLCHCLGQVFMSNATQQYDAEVSGQNVFKVKTVGETGARGRR
jgi:hypothetical protein